MPRNRRGSDGPEETQDLNLAPFMNMVVILIPLLLLSVVFLKIGVVNITAPKLSVGPPSDKKPKKDDKKPLNLTVGVGAKGFRVAATGAVLPPQGNCPESGPTLCLADQSADVEKLIQQAREAYDQEKKEKAERLLKQAEDAYDWVGLYNKLMEIKKEYPKETVMNVSGDPNIPYSLVIRVMDVARNQLKEDSYKKPKEFWAADPVMNVKTIKGKKTEVPKALFNDPVLAVTK